MNKLKMYLSINSTFSAFSGLVMLLFSSQLNNFFNLSHLYVFPFIGANLLAFSAFVYYVSQKQLSNKLLVNIISSLDALWVLGSIVIIGLGLFNLSSIGYIAIFIVAVWIGFLGFQQYQHNN
jgi:hypothetical protein